MLVQRDTAQRRAIRQVLLEAQRPLSPQEILAGARALTPNMGIATVYRTIKELAGTGWLAPVELPGEAQRFEVAGKSHHHHFSCRVCGRVYQMDGCPADLERLLPTGFSMEAHQIFLYGVCGPCHLKR